MVNYSLFKEDSIKGRYVTLAQLQNHFFSKIRSEAIYIGKSVKGENIPAFQFGHGKFKVLMWSQMHGNESTTTKAVCDMIHFLQSEDVLAKHILSKCSITVVPILNPDGAEVYTRINHNEVDLNRDAKDRTQPESQALRKLFKKIHPQYCFNLHDQRTLFSAGNTQKPATVSFLSPSSNVERDITPTREAAMKLIVAMNYDLQELIPGQVGRYDDGFNENCTGDSFQTTGTPTILFEAGHYAEDYEREKTREYIFHALIKGLQTIADNQVNEFSTNDYFKIPENRKLFFDVVVWHANKVNPKFKEGVKVGIRFKEVLIDDKIEFIPEIAEKGTLEGYFGHKLIECIDSKDFGFSSKDKKVLELLQNFDV
ncbi:M14 family zinc carboxypeptidase [Flagellimonas zhangzhouensis]|uniref:Zinc carboxypeptidase n=1 Tax=Flagellimonas zhangzhouensis TaxID=1073328 RepID=A0A1H2SP85_9FLAO|nr:M14 family zinc carboxypeptidase [Allomuricauda zhangzhouensis]SDQ77491.1 Zinc carboxypeptidase [Allomuricauda zhangzhouensis]SDW33473.1 Zinc carboxypeptidase [Allomuricauda zhangzhouensis]